MAILPKKRKGRRREEIEGNRYERKIKSKSWKERVGGRESKPKRDTRRGMRGINASRTPLGDRESFLTKRNAAMEILDTPQGRSLRYLIERGGEERESVCAMC
jgi:hypothetical protein